MFNIFKKKIESIVKKVKNTVEAKKIDKNIIENIIEELKFDLLELNVAYEVSEELSEKIGDFLLNKEIKRKDYKNEIKKLIKKYIKDSFNQFDLLEKIKNYENPVKIMFLGINGSGKTTTIAKVGSMLKNNNYSVVMAAADTYRAAAIEQLEIHCNKLDIKMIKGMYGGDAAAVCFDAIKHAEAKKKDIVLIDTAGRLHSNKNLMDEMKKIVNVAKPDIKILILDALAGNDVIEQLRGFEESIGIDTVILTRVDIDEKAGAILSIGKEKPIAFLGTGQKYEDLKLFDPNKFVELIL